MQETIDKTGEMMSHFAAVDRILEANNYDSSRMIPILQAIQEQDTYLSEEVMTYVAAALKVPASKVYGVATFYAHFTLSPKGKHILRVCDGTACHVKKSHGILELINKKLGLGDEKVTTSDGLFTLEIVSCLGACGLAPVMVLDEHVNGQCTPAKAEALIDEVIASEKA